jgi:hypothetical protein
MKTLLLNQAADYNLFSTSLQRSSHRNRRREALMARKARICYICAPVK